MFKSVLLDVAYHNHKGHPGLTRGLNFVECPTCEFHVHIHKENGYLTKHWRGDSYDREPIISVDDPRLS